MLDQRGITDDKQKKKKKKKKKKRRILTPLHLQYISFRKKTTAFLTIQFFLKKQNKEKKR